MTVREYIGARYVPIFMGNWDNTNTYEPLSIVQNNGNSYTSKQYVPTGIEITNEEYWAETGNYNAQIEQYRNEVLDVVDRMDDIDDEIISINEDLAALENVDIEQSLQEAVFAPYTRTIFRNDDDIYTSFQVSTMDENEQYIYVVTPYTSSDQSTTKNSVVRVINPQTGEIIVSKELDVGHGRSLTVKNDIMLTSNQYAEANNEWVAIDISNKINPQLVSRGNFNGRHIFWTDEGAACYTGENTIKFFNVTYDVNGYPVSFVENGNTIQFNKGIKGEEQSFQYWNGYIIISSTLPESIIIIKASNGEQVSYISLREKYNFMRTAECESAFIINNHLYFSNNSRVAPEKSGITNMEFGLFRCDFLNPKGEWYDFWLQKTYQSSRGDLIYVSGQRPAASSVSSDGGVNSPYWFVEDALQSYAIDKRLHFSEDMLVKYLSISFTRSTYDYRIYISNATECCVALNGYGSSTTQVPCVFAFNSNVTLNRLDIEQLADQSETQTSNEVGIYADNSNIRATNTVSFLSETAGNVDVLARNLSTVYMQGDIGRALAYTFSEINANKVTSCNASTGGIVKTSQIAFNNNVTQFSSGASDTSQWINIIMTNGKMYRLFMESNRLRLEYYPDATQVGAGQHETLWTIPATLPNP